jgi:hypothetical protein
MRAALLTDRHSSDMLDRLLQWVSISVRSPAGKYQRRIAPSSHHIAAKSQTEHVFKQFIERLRFARCTGRGQGQGKHRPNQQRTRSTPPNAVSNFMQRYRGAVCMQRE